MHPTRGHSADQYLQAVHALASAPGAAGGTTTASRVAEWLGVSRAAAGEMLKRLEADRLVERDDRRALRLTGSGTERAERAVRRQRIAERFLTDYVGYEPADCTDEARRLGDALTDDLAERMLQRLGAPERCPHGWPIDAAAERAENADLVALDEVESGESVAVVRLSERDSELLVWFYKEGFIPGASVDVVEFQHAAGQLDIVLDGKVRSVTEKAAASVLVRREPDS